MKRYLSYLYNYYRSRFNNYVFFVLYILTRPKKIMLIFNGIYLPQYFQYEWMSKLDIGTFIDIGAHDGTVSKVIHYISPKTTIYAFEPIPTKRTLIESKIKSRSFSIETLALSNYAGKQLFHQYSFQPASSLLKPQHKNKWAWGVKNNIRKSYTVKVTTLDKYFSKIKLKKPIFIKMDTQGTEDLIIKGGQKILKESALVIIETSFVKFYQNQCLFNDIYEEIIKLGFIYKGSLLESNFYPFFKPHRGENSLFIKRNTNNDYLK